MKYLVHSYHECLVSRTLGDGLGGPSSSNAGPCDLVQLCRWQQDNAARVFPCKACTLPYREQLASGASGSCRKKHVPGVGGKQLCLHLEGPEKRLLQQVSDMQRTGLSSLLPGVRADVWEAVS